MTSPLPWLDEQDVRQRVVGPAVDALTALLDSGPQQGGDALAELIGVRASRAALTLAREAAWELIKGDAEAVEALDALTRPTREALTARTRLLEDAVPRRSGPPAGTAAAPVESLLVEKTCISVASLASHLARVAQGPRLGSGASVDIVLRAVAADLCADVERSWNQVQRRKEIEAAKVPKLRTATRFPRQPDSAFAASMAGLDNLLEERAVPRLDLSAGALNAVRDLVVLAADRFAVAERVCAADDAVGLTAQLLADGLRVVAYRAVTSASPPAPVAAAVAKRAGAATVEASRTPHTNAALFADALAYGRRSGQSLQATLHERPLVPAWLERAVAAGQKTTTLLATYLYAYGVQHAFLDGTLTLAALTTRNGEGRLHAVHAAVRMGRRGARQWLDAADPLRKLAGDVHAGATGKAAPDMVRNPWRGARPEPGAVALTSDPYFSVKAAGSPPAKAMPGVTALEKCAPEPAADPARLPRRRRLPTYGATHGHSQGLRGPGGTC